MASSISGTSIEKEGYLWVKHPKQPKQLKVKKWQYKYAVLKKCSEYKSSAYLEWYENIEDFSVLHTPTSFIKLDAINFVGKIESQKKVFAFILFVGDKQQQFATKDEAGQTEWIEAIKQFQHLNPGAASPTIDPRSCFDVKFTGTTSSSELLKDNTDYLLNVGPKCITLLTSGAVKERVVSWSLATIKSYKSHPTDSQSSKKLLTIETGRQSSTGRGMFYFLTQFGDQIADKVRLNTNRTYLAKVNSQDSFNLDAVYSSSPEIATSRLSSSPNRLRSIRMSPSLSGRSSPIPFHQYDSPSGSPREPFANYVSDGTGYIHVLTKQEDVEESRRGKARKVSQPSTEQEPASPEDECSTYIEVLEEPDVDSSTYIEVIGEHEPRNPTKSRDQTQRPRGPLDEYGEDIYIDVIGDDEESRTKYEETSSETRDKIRHDIRQTSHVSPRGTRHQIRHGSHHEMRKTRENVSSVGSAHWRSMTSQTSSFEYSSVSSENDVFSRERDMSLTSDVFPEVEEPTTSTDDIHEGVSEKNNNLTESCGEVSGSVRESLGKSGSFRESHESEPKDQTVDAWEREGVTDCKNACASSENLSENYGNARVSSGNLSENSENARVSSGNFSDNSGNARVSSGNLSENSGNTCGNSENSCDDDNSKTSSLHSETGRDAEDTSELRDDSTNTSSTSDDGNPRDSQDLSDDELGEKTGPGPRRRSEEILSGSAFLKGASLGDDLDPRTRDRSRTTGDMRSLESCGELSQEFLEDLIERVTNPQDFFPPKKHPPLARTTTVDQGDLEDGNSFQQKIIDELMNPTARPIECGSRGLSTRRQSSEIKYLCTECGWTKMWREKSRWKKAKATKNCGRCNKVITKSISKSSVKRKESSSKKERTGSLLGRFTSKFHSSTSVDYVEAVVRPERTPPAHQESLFLKNLKQGNLSIHTHLSSEAEKRVMLGIAPSPFQNAHALSIGGALASPKSPPIKNENVLPASKRPLTTTRSEESVSSVSQGEGCVAGRNAVSKTLTYTPAHDAGKGTNLLKRANSSPVCIGTASGSPEFPRKSSFCNNALPSLPEVEDIPEGTGNVRSCSFTDAPPAIPPRTREEPPPVPPRRSTGTQMSRGNSAKLKRSQTDPINPVTIPSPMLLRKAQLSRTMTDPGNKHIMLNDNIRTAVSLGNLLEESQDSRTGTNRTLIRVVSLSLGDGLDTPPPPLPPRKNSGPPPPVSPRRVSNDSGKPSCESQTFSESARQLPENGSFGSPSKKLPLVAKQSQEARENFKSRNPLYSEHVNEDETFNSSSYPEKFP